MLKNKIEGKIPLNNKNSSTSVIRPETARKNDPAINPPCQHNYSDRVALALGMKTSKPLPVPQRQSSRIRNIPAPELPKVQGRPIEYKEYSYKNEGDRPAPQNRGHN